MLGVLDKNQLFNHCDVMALFDFCLLLFASVKHCGMYLKLCVFLSLGSAKIKENIM